MYALCIVFNYIFYSVLTATFCSLYFISNIRFPMPCYNNKIALLINKIIIFKK